MGQLVGLTRDEPVFGRPNPVTADFWDWIHAAPDPSQAGDAVTALFSPAVAHNRAAYIVTRVPKDYDLRREANRLWALSWTKDDPGYVYFVLAPELQRVKIGFSRDVTKRFTQLANGSPCALSLLGKARAVPFVETRLHDIVSREFAYGEWYHFRGVVPGVVETAISASNPSATP